MQFSPSQALEALKRLPQNTQDHITSPEATAATVRIADKYNLQKEQRVKFNYIVGTLLLQLVDKKQAEGEFIKELALTQEQARAVAGDIEREIFNNTNYEQGTKVRTEEEKKPGQNLPPIPPPLIKEGAGGGFSNAPKPPLPKSPLEGSTPTPVGGRDVSPRPVPIRKIAPPPPNPDASRRDPDRFASGLQTLLADIRRGTAFDEARIADAYRKTPIEIRQSLESIGFLSRLQGVARKFGLNVEETGELVSETGLVLLGLTKPPQFIDNLAKRLRLPRDRAFAVGQAVNMEVLRPVREIIRKMNEPTENTPPRLADSAPLPASPAGGLNQGGDAKKDESGLRFAPGVSSFSRPFQDIPRPSGTPFQGGTLHSSLEGSTPTPVGGRDVSPLAPEVKKYVADPYREPLE